MARPGITQVILSLTTDDMREVWGQVKSHYGTKYSNSHVLYDLVRIKSNEISEKITNRERYTAIDARLTHIEELLSEIRNELRRNTGEL